MVYTIHGINVFIYDDIIQFWFLAKQCSRFSSIEFYRINNSSERQRRYSAVDSTGAIPVINPAGTASVVARERVCAQSFRVMYGSHMGRVARVGITNVCDFFLFFPHPSLPPPLSRRTRPGAVPRKGCEGEKKTELYSLQVYYACGV